MQLSKLKFVTNLRALAVVAALAIAALTMNAQKAAIKTNIIGDASGSIALGAEFPIAQKWTMDVATQINAWNMGGLKRWKHFFLQPAARYWLCDRFDRHFIGVNLMGGTFDVGGFDPGFNFLGLNLRKMADNRFKGWMMGAGVSYGYDFIITRHINSELEIGVGYLYNNYYDYTGPNLDQKADVSVTKHYVGPTKLAANFVYVF